MLSVVVQNLPVGVNLNLACRPHVRLGLEIPRRSAPIVMGVSSTLFPMALEIVHNARSGLTTDSPTGLQESAQPYLQQECRGNTESWDRRWKWVLDFLHGEGNAAKMPAKPPNTAEPGMSIFSKGSGAGAGGREAGGAAPGGHLFGLRAALLPLSAGSLAAVERGYAS